MRKRKLETISLKEQLKREQDRKMVKKIKRIRKNPPQMRQAEVRVGNKDFGVPYHGKDKFSGMWKKFADRVYEDVVERENPDTGEMEDVTIRRVMVYDNNKYTGSGKLKELEDF